MVEQPEMKFQPGIDIKLSPSQPVSYEEVSTICKKALDEIIGQSNYQHMEAVKWNEKAVVTITENLVALGRQYKYCVTCVAMQTGLGAGLNVASCCYWDSNTDTAFAYRWDGKAVITICNVFATAL